MPHLSAALALAATALLVWLLPTPAVAQSIGLSARIEVSASINVRATPGGALLGSQTAGQQGTVLEGPRTSP